MPTRRVPLLGQGIRQRPEATKELVLARGVYPGTPSSKRDWEDSEFQIQDRV